MTMTIYEDAQYGKLVDEIKEISKYENLDPLKLLNEVAKGRAIIMKNNNAKSLGIGSILRTKINVNLGTSSSIQDENLELKKLIIAQKYGADTISDLSMGENIDQIRKNIIKNSQIPITTVPIYQAVVEAKSILDVSENIIFKVIEKQIDDGISSLVIHAAFTLNDLQKMKNKRIMGIVSKGGSFTASIMHHNSIENPFLKNFDYILEMLKEKDIVLNLGNAMRSGCVHDLMDEFHLVEIIRNSKLAKQANKEGIQVILESLGGHVNVRDLLDWIKIHKFISNRRPLFVSGPLPTDIAVGYDHIAASIGGTFASGFGADYLCAITPAEHLRLPSEEDIKEGLIACKIAAHVGDSLKFGLNYLFDNDLKIAKYRYMKRWKEQFKFGIDPEKKYEEHQNHKKVCSMCGKYCALSISKKIFAQYR